MRRDAQYDRVVHASRNSRFGALGAGLLALATLAGCGDHGASAAQADKRRAADHLRTFLIERDWQRWPEYFAPNATLNGSDLALQIMRGTAEGLNFSFADLKLTIREQVAEREAQGVHDRLGRAARVTRQQHIPFPTFPDHQRRVRVLMGGTLRAPLASFTLRPKSRREFRRPHECQPQAARPVRQSSVR